MIFRYIKNQFQKDHDITVEDSYTVNMEGKNGENTEIKILDTSGEEDYQNMLDQWISSANGFLLVFAINDLETLQALNSKIERIAKNEAQDLPKILAGNKCDLKDQRKVSKQQAEEFAKNINAKYYETSALEDINVKTVFQECANMILGNNTGKNDEEKNCFKCNIY